MQIYLVILFLGNILVNSSNRSNLRLLLPEAEPTSHVTCDAEHLECEFQ